MNAGLLQEHESRHGGPSVPASLLGPRIGSMCTGYGGLDLAVMEAYGVGLAWCADNDPHVSKILEARFNGVPNLGDLAAVDWNDVPRVDIVTAGFPCQDISYAGRAAGMTKETRSGLWFTIAEALRVLRPGLVILENVPALRSRGLDRVLGGLAALGYDTAWTCVRASDIGAPHRRERIFIEAKDPANAGLPSAPAHACGVQSQRWGDGGVMARTKDEAEASARDATRHSDQAIVGRASDRCGNRWTASRPCVPDPATSDAEGERRYQGIREADGLQGIPDPAGHGHTSWGIYAAAIHRWEAVLGRPAPPATEHGVRGQLRLSARFVEWMMGLPDGWVTGIELPRTAYMRALGNGVVPQQAVHALMLLNELPETAVDQ